MSNYKYRRDHYYTGDESSSSSSSSSSFSSSSWNRSSGDDEERGLDWLERSSPPNQDDMDNSNSNSTCSSSTSTFEVKRNEKDRDRKCNHDSGRSNATFPLQFRPPTLQTSNDSLDLIAFLFSDASDVADASHDYQHKLTEPNTVVLPEPNLSTEKRYDGSEPSPEQVRDLVGATRRRPRYYQIFHPEEWSSRQMIISMIACGVLLLVVLAMIIWGIAALANMVQTNNDAEESTNLYEPCRYHSDCESADSACVLPWTDQLQQPSVDEPICCPNEQLVRVVNDDNGTRACGKRSNLVEDGEACTSALDCRVSNACAAASLEEEAASICCPSGSQLYHEGTGRDVCDDAPLGTVCGDFQVMCQSGLCLIGLCAEEKLNIRQECSSDFECKTNLCGRTIDQIGSHKVCCASQKEHQSLLGQPISLEKESLCTDMPIGTVCNDDGICASRHCLEGVCAEPMLLQDLQRCNASKDCRSGACSFESVGNSAEQICCPNGETVDHISFGSLDTQTTCGSMPNGIDCNGNGMCASGQCIKGICSAP